MIEKEYKYVVTYKAFQNYRYYITKKYGILSPEVVNQTNFYYDTKDFFFYKNDITLRVRQIGKTLQLQKKIKKQQVFSSVESEEIITSIANIPDIIGGNVAGTKGNVYLLGKLETKRYRYKISDDMEIDFDENTYLGITDYEIEIEYKNDLPMEFSICRYILSPETITGKYSRFFNRYIENIKGKAFDEINQNIG